MYTRLYSPCICIKYDKITIYIIQSGDLLNNKKKVNTHYNKNRSQFERKEITVVLCVKCEHTQVIPLDST